VGGVGAYLLATNKRRRKDVRRAVQMLSRDPSPRRSRLSLVASANIVHPQKTILYTRMRHDTHSQGPVMGAMGNVVGVGGRMEASQNYVNVAMNKVGVERRTKKRELGGPASVEGLDGGW